MNDVDMLGPDGGRLAIAFATGCVAAFAFLSTVGGFIWKTIGKARQDRIDELSAELQSERERCAAMEDHLVRRIEQLETVLMMSTSGAKEGYVRKRISHARRDYNEERQEEGG